VPLEVRVPALGTCEEVPQVKSIKKLHAKLNVSLPYLTFHYKTDDKKYYVRRGNLDQISLRELLGFAHCGVHKGYGMLFRNAVFRNSLELRKHTMQGLRSEVRTYAI